MMVHEGGKSEHAQSDVGIPRIVHQAFWGGRNGKMPRELRDAIQALADRNPLWEFRLYDEVGIEAVLQEKFGTSTVDLYRTIESTYGAARADFFRYHIMYAVGGMYLDIKSGATVPLDEIARRCGPYALINWDNGKGGTHEGWGRHPELENFPRGEFQQWNIVAVPGHPFLNAVIREVTQRMKAYTPWTHGVGRNGVFRVTGPIAYSLAINPIRERYAHKRFANEREAGLIYNILGEGKHRSIFNRHYAYNALPIIRKSGFAGFYQDTYVKPIQVFYWLVALKARLGVFVRRRPRLASILRSFNIIR